MRKTSNSLTFLRPVAVCRKTSLTVERLVEKVQWRPPKLISLDDATGLVARRSEARGRRRAAAPQADRVPGGARRRGAPRPPPLLVPRLARRRAARRPRRRRRGARGLRRLRAARVRARLRAGRRRGRDSRLRVQRAPLRLGPARVASPGSRSCRRAARAARISSPSSACEEVACPYTGERLLAAPAIRPDVCVIHAEAADEQGNVMAPSTHDFLFDSDATLARAADDGDRDGGADRPDGRDPQRRRAALLVRGRRCRGAAARRLADGVAGRLRRGHRRRAHVPRRRPRAMPTRRPWRWRERRP